jgi:hypothetical protein
MLTFKNEDAYAVVAKNLGYVHLPHPPPLPPARKWELLVCISNE